MGYIKNPGKALNNSFYHQTTTSVYNNHASNAKNKAKPNDQATPSDTDDGEQLTTSIGVGDEQIISEVQRFTNLWQSFQKVMPEDYFNKFRPHLLYIMKEFTLNPDYIYSTNEQTEEIIKDIQESIHQIQKEDLDRLYLMALSESLASNLQTVKSLNDGLDTVNAYVDIVAPYKDVISDYAKDYFNNQMDSIRQQLKEQFKKIDDD